MFQPVPSNPNFPQMERETLQWWKDSDAFNQLRQLRARSQKTWSFMDGPITANNPMGVHHAWGRTYKDLFQRYRAMTGHNQRWQNGFDCQGLWVEVNVEKDLGFKTKKDIEDYGLAPFVILCKQRVLNFAAVQTEQSIRLGMWMDWNDPDMLRLLRDRLGEDPETTLTVKGPLGDVTGTVEQIVGQLGLPQLGGSYFTFSDKNNYDIWKFLKTCYEHGWVYKGTDVMPWCWRCGTGISQHEIVTEGYTEVTHTSLTVRFPLRERSGEYLLVWTTMPWTLIPNVMAAVGPDLTYLKVRQGDSVYYLSEHTTHMLKGAYEVIGKLKGSEMEGWTYSGPFDELPAEQEVGGHVAPELRLHVHRPSVSAAQAHRVILYKEVNETEGTGLVHMGTGGGPEDFRLGKEYNLPIVAPLDENGVFMEGFGEFSGMNAFDVVPKVIESLEQKGLLYRTDPYTHRYPHCWRCATPLVFRLVDEWFIGMDGLRGPLMDITHQIRWVPDFGRDRELDWLRNMHDWMISKKRYWGLALPIWECEHCGHFDVIGSREELEERAVEGWDEFDGHTPHRPHIDAVKVACSKCGGKVARIKDVGNPWLDAGIVSFSTLGYGEDVDYWRKWFPADFITESFPGQFRNWFYSLLTMAAALENKPATRTVLGFATLLGEDGRPMHKSWGNSIEFNEAADNIGADVMRWMFCNQRYETDILFGYRHADETRRQFLLPLWNVYSFFVTYARLDGWQPEVGSRKPEVGNQKSEVGSQKSEVGSDLDRWILARLQQVIGEVTDALEDYHAYKATRPVEEFLDDLSNWYVRRSRRRFWRSEADADKQAAYSTLYEVLTTLTRLLAPMVPFVTEHLYQNLVRAVDSGAKAPMSVHHCDWPEVNPALVDEALLAEMKAARTVVTLGHAVRAAGSLKVRQPLSRVIVVAPPEQRQRLTRNAALVTDELNVRALEFAANESDLVTYKLLPDNRLLGPRFGALFPKVRAAIAAADPNAAVAALRAGQPLGLDVEGQAVEVSSAEVLVTPQPKSGFAVKAEGEYVVALDTAITPELRAEGLAREVVRRIQDLRKSAGFDIADRITTYYLPSDGLGRAITAHAEYVKGETLSVELVRGNGPEGAATAEDSFDGETLELALTRVKKGQPT